jgi:hypothetical protein
LTASATVSKTGTPRTFSPPLPGGDAADDLGAVLERLFGVEGPTLPVMPWTMRRVFLSTRTLMTSPPDESDDLGSRVPQVAGGDDVEAAFVEHLLAEFDVGALEADHQRDAERPTSLTAAITPVAITSHFMMPPKMLTRIPFTRGRG